MTIVSQTSSSITLSNINTADMLQGATRILTGWTIVTPPSTRNYTITITSYYSISGGTYGIDTRTNQYNNVASAITTFSLVSNSYSINALATYIFTFTTVNNLISGSTITITFPSYISIQSGGTCSSSNGLLSCVVTSSTMITATISGAVNKATIITITVAQVINPTQALTSASFAINTYYDSGTDSLVDSVATGLTFTSIAKQLASNVFAVPSSYVTYASANYIFSIQLIDKIIAGGYISITFPGDIIVGTVSISSASFSISTCTIGVVGNVVNIQNCFASDYATLGIAFTLSGLRNPTSLKPTDSFIINTYGPLGLINYINSGLIVTMTTAATSTSFSISPGSLLVHANTLYTIDITFSVPHISTDYLIL